MENRSDTIVELAKALCKAQAMIKGAVKDSSNPFFKSTYADLASVWDACREPLTSNGLSIIQTTEMVDMKPILKTLLVHDSGEWVAGVYPIIPMRQAQGVGWTPSEDPQSMGSAVTYARRYTLAAMVGIAPEDDDGEAAMGREKDKPKDKKPEKAPEPPPTPLTFDLAMARLKEIEVKGNSHELRNWFTKHWPEIQTLTPEEQAEVVKYKDFLKEKFNENKSAPKV